MTPLPFTTEPELTGPWSVYAETLVRHDPSRPEAGTNLARMYVREQDRHRLWVVCPLDGLVGSTMENFVERLASSIAALGEHDASLLTWWPAAGGQGPGYPDPPATDRPKT